MGISPPLSVSSMSAIGLTVAIAFILLASNFVIISAQQQLTSQQGGMSNGISPTKPVTTTPPTVTIFQSTNDNFSTQIPDGWTIHDLNNTGSILSEELRQGYGILAQLCPEEEQIQRGAVSTSNNSCQGVQEVVHVIRYPDLDTRIPAANNATSMVSSTMTIEDVLSYTLKKLQEIGYRNIQILNNTDTQVNITNSQTNQTVATLPAKFVEMTYSFGGIVDSNELRKSYFILTASAATTPDEGTVKGYSVFYEDNGNTNNTTTAATLGITSTSAAATSSSLVPQSLPSSAKQVLDSFELIISQVPAAPLTSRVQTPEEADGFGSGGNAGGVGGSSGDDVADGSAGNIDDEDDDAGDDSCHPSYSDTCIPPPPPNLNCDDVEDTNFGVVGSDPHGFDGDNDGIGCETGTGDSGGGGGNDVDDNDDGDGGGGADDEESDEDGGSDDEGSSRCPNGYHRSPSGDCERVTDTSGMPRCPNGYHRSPDGDCERV